MKVLFAVSEASPFVITGGLGEVGGSLPVALSRQKAEVRVILPKYATIPQQFLEQTVPVANWRVQLGWRNLYCGLEELVYGGVHYYFIDNEFYFKREQVYGYGDDAERFAFFSKAVLESTFYMEDFKPDIIHAHDWHTALIPYLLKAEFANNPFYYDVKTVFTIHNLKYQGTFAHFVYDDILGLSGNAQAWEIIEYYGGVNFMKAAIKTADRVTTVSPTYMLEIQNAFFGETLENVIHERGDSLYGILNGIDTEKYDPLNDPNLFVNYRSSLSKKEENKLYLQELLNLQVRGNVPLIAFVSRLVPQKGLDLILHVLNEILTMDVQLVVLGAGEKHYEDALAQFAASNAHKMAITFSYDEVLAHKIYAAADILLMPSLYEPCGLTQMIGMRYGVIPVVRETGGLKDTVIPYDENTGEGNGFSFANYNAHELLFALQRAVKEYYDEKLKWKGLVENARKGDFSWNKSAEKYFELYEALLA
ncbi:MAG: glycogen synthase GlgA [Peptococcaceae bacterium]|jgi:starch synthase|nr:glycogen synthase GlgA [Peptococcaceae bacterium]